MEDAATTQAEIGMTVALISFSMLFATLFLAYFIYRFNAQVWPPLGTPGISLFYPTLSTFFVVASGFSYSRFKECFLSGSNHRTSLFQTFGLGMAFLLCQLMVAKKLNEQGLSWDTDIFSSLLYSFTLIHGVHLAAAIIALFWLLGKKSKTLVENIGKFWHFLGVVWVLMYLILFIL